MIVTGGLYFETCEEPFWRQLFGSGGRAAWALAASSPGIELHTYMSAGTDLTFYRSAGVNVVGRSARSAVAFSYFHPLSRPHIELEPRVIQREPPLHVEGSAVIRFSFVEGDSIVDAERAIYDPQTSNAPSLFRSNGSRAKYLAIILNEGELKTLARCNDTHAAAVSVMDKDQACVVVAKRGLRGATVFERNGAITRVPPYRSSRVFKIGTGDIFTAAFAHHWAERGKSPYHAADLASRTVAAYCDAPQIPPTPETNAEPISKADPGCVLLLGSVRSIGDRWMLEEARWCLRDLGADVLCPALGETRGVAQRPNSVLAFDFGEDVVREEIDRALADEIPVVALTDTANLNLRDRQTDRHCSCVGDFATAIYAAAWRSAH